MGTLQSIATIIKGLMSLGPLIEKIVAYLDKQKLKKVEKHIKDKEAAKKVLSAEIEKEAAKEVVDEELIKDLHRRLSRISI